MSTAKLTAAQKRRNQRVSRYRQLVKPLARHYARHCPEPLDDLIQVGMLGLLRAAELYSPGEGVPFEVFARAHVRGAILHYLRDVAPVVRLPRRLGERQHQLKGLLRQWRHQHGREPNAEELRQCMGLSKLQWQQLQRASVQTKVYSLEGHDVPHPQEGFDCPLERAGECAIHALEHLEEPIRMVVRQAVLEGRSYRSIAAGLQVSPMTVQRRLHRGLAQLRERLSLTHPWGSPAHHPVASAAAGC